MITAKKDGKLFAQFSSIADAAAFIIGKELSRGYTSASTNICNALKDENHVKQARNGRPRTV
jgi:ApbE superfamily uncharacterized protein (UPF0280 family)